MKNFKYLLLVAVVLPSLVACDKTNIAHESKSPYFKTTATLQDLMAFIIDPVADELWQSVETEVTLTGLVETKPKTDEEWLKVRQQAITLIESANLLQIPGRPIASVGKKLEDSDVSGIYSADEIFQAIEKNAEGFAKEALLLSSGAEKALKAIDAKNADALQEAGGEIYHACESCHLKFWYPNAQKPPVVK